MIIGLDDTDSVNGMCTTYIGTLIVGFKDTGSDLIRSPQTFAFNQIIPIKQGNGAVSIRIRENSGPRLSDKIKSVSRYITKYSESGDS